MEKIVIEQRSRREDREIHQTVHWNPRQTAIIICDMWDDHTCKAAAQRVGEMVPTMNRMVSAARKAGVFIIHAPSGTMSFYDKTPQRRRAIEAAFTESPVEIKWNYWDPEREGAPLPFIRNGGCGCSEPCPGWVADDQGSRQWKGGAVPWIAADRDDRNRSRRCNQRRRPRGLQPDAGARHRQCHPDGCSHQYLRLWTAVWAQADGLPRKKCGAMP